MIVPFALALDEEWGLGLMTQYDIIQNADRDGHVVQFVNSITTGRSLTDEIGFYVELWSAASKNEGHQLTLDGGFTYSPQENTQLDIGLNTGLTDHADDLNPFIGISQRF